MGVVYAAEDPSLGRRVALKTITHPDEESRMRFRREARAAASVNHPHACQIFEIGEDTGRLFIAMELLDGEPLSERLKRGPLALAEALSLGREMLSALGALHAQGVVHRDLKPSNVFLTPHGTKLLDFGLARPLPKASSGALSRESDLTRSGLMVGTPRYMAPEQILGDAIDARIDLFAAGAVLFEALAGRPAFAGTKAVEVMQATLHEQPPGPRGVPRGRGLRSRDPPGPRQVSRRPLRRPRRPCPATSRASSSGTPSSPRLRLVALTRLVVLPFRVLRPDPEIDFLGLALADAVSTSLSGLPSLVVRSSAAASRFAAEAPDLQAIATELDVDLVLLGTLLRSGDRLRVATQLVEAPAGTLTWSHTHRVAGGRRVSPAGRARPGDRRVAVALPRRPRPARAPGRDSGHRARLRVLPARQRGRPRLHPVARGARPLPPVRGGGSQVRPGLGAARAGASPHRQVPRDVPSSPRIRRGRRRPCAGPWS